jgi:hypothetical protein
VPAAAKRLRILLPLATWTVLAAGAHAASKPSDKGVAFRWVDEQGVVHYGDHIPPQYANQERTVLNGQGIAVAHVDAQKTPEQQDADARNRAAAMKQKQHDAFLVSTYTSVKDIEAQRDERLDQLKSKRAAAEQYVESLRVRLASLEERALGYRPYSSLPAARAMPDDLAESLVRTVLEMREQTGALAASSATETALRAQFQADIERYRELHTLHSQ